MLGDTSIKAGIQPRSIEQAIAYNNNQIIKLKNALGTGDKINGLKFAYLDPEKGIASFKLVNILQ